MSCTECVSMFTLSKSCRDELSKAMGCVTPASSPALGKCKGKPVRNSGLGCMAK